MILSQAAADDELKKVQAAEVEEASLQSFAYLRLGDEDFERLAYALAKASAPVGMARSWDGAALMVRGADAGRDVLLTREGRPVGVIQCKRLESLVSLPAVFREIAKLILFAAVNGDLSFDKKLVYFLAVARDPAATVVDFFARCKELQPLKTADIRTAAREVRDTYVTIKGFTDAEAEEKVLGAMQCFEFHLLRPTDFDQWLGSEPTISGQFFRQRLVVDNSVVEKHHADVMAVLAAISGRVSTLSPVTDEDIVIMQDLIEQTPETHRLNVGIAMLFGFPREMFVGRPNLEARAGRLAALQNEINEDYIEWVFAKAQAMAQAINESPEAASMAVFARQLPLQFLNLVAKECLGEALSGAVMNEIIDKLTKSKQFETDEARLDHVRAELEAQGNRYLEGDFSELVGDADLLAQKRALIDWLMVGIEQPKHIGAALDHALTLLKPALLSAADGLRELCKHKTTIVLTGSRGIDTKSSLKRMIDTARALEEAKSGQEGGNDRSQGDDADRNGADVTVRED